MHPILKKDGARKNDCERNAAVRLLEDVRREHPHLKLIVVEDGLASNGPHINLLKRLDLRFILGAKPGDHKFLFEWVNSAPSVEHQEFTDENDIRHEFRYGVPSERYALSKSIFSNTGRNAQTARNNAGLRICQSTRRGS